MRLYKYHWSWHPLPLLNTVTVLLKVYVLSSTFIEFHWSDLNPSGGDHPHSSFYESMILHMRSRAICTTFVAPVCKAMFCIKNLVLYMKLAYKPKCTVLASAIWQHKMCTSRIEIGSANLFSVLNFTVWFICMHS